MNPINLRGVLRGRRAPSRAFLIGAVLASTTACGQQEDAVPSRSYQTIGGTTSRGTWTSSQSMAVANSIERLGRTQEHDLIAVFDGRVHQARADGLDMRARYAGDQEPLSYGTVYDIEPRPSGGGAYLAADQGLFLLGPLFVTRSPLSDEIGTVHAVTEAPTGALSGLWLATENGLYRNTPAGLERLSIEDITTAPSHVAVELGGRFGAAVFGDELLTLHEIDGEFVARPESLPSVGAIHDVAGASGTLWVATDRGLLAYRPDLAPAWTHYTLTDAEPATVLAIALDTQSDGVWARTHDALIRVTEDERARFEQPASSVGRPSLGTDRLGQIWTSENEARSITAWSAATREDLSSFDRDLAPWIETHCAQCHSNQTADFRDYDVFQTRAYDALSRVQTGDMPRCEGGLRCPEDEHLTRSEYEILEQWIRDGLRP